MRRLFFLCSVGLVSIGSLTGCRGTDADNARRASVLPASSTPGQAVATAKTPAPVKVEVLAVPTTAIPRAPVSPEVVTYPPTAKPAAVTPPPPRLPAVNEVAPVPLPAPPAWKTSVETGPTPGDKIVIIANLEPAEVKAAPRPSEAVPAPKKENPAAIKEAPTHLGHDAHFESITGQVYEYRRAFRLRYAAIDQADVYGGVVTLEGSVDLSALRDGKHVRVRGELIPPTDRNGSARYRVTALELLD